MEKIWKEVIKPRARYRISYCGIVEKEIKNTWQPLVCYLNNRGYVMCALGLVHRLVATYHIPNPFNKQQVNHKDLNKLNCHGDNLEWNTPKENTEHAILNGVKNTGVSLGSSNGQSVLTEELVKEIKSLLALGTISSTKIAKKFNVSQATISGIKNNKFWKNI